MLCHSFHMAAAAHDARHGYFGGMFPRIHMVIQHSSEALTQSHKTPQDKIAP